MYDIILERVGAKIFLVLLEKMLTDTEKLSSESKLISYWLYNYKLLLFIIFFFSKILLRI